MSGQFLEPRLLVRAARHYQLTLSERRADHLSGMLATSRGVTLMGPAQLGSKLARVIIDAAADSGVSAGVTEVKRGAEPDHVRQEVEQGRWLIIEGGEGRGLTRMIEALGPILEVTARRRTRRRPEWRVLLVHEPTPERLLPLPPTLMRHFPLFDVSEESLS
jgi:hypothetical protein